jgi:hypothetical protein
MMQESIWSELLNHTEIFGIMIPIVGIIATSIIVLVKFVIHHRERMAMIERGIHPNYPPEDEKTEDAPPS